MTKLAGLAIALCTLGACGLDFDGSKQNPTAVPPRWHPPDLVIDCGAPPVEPRWSAIAVAEPVEHIEIPERQWLDMAIWLQAMREWTACIELERAN